MNVRSISPEPAVDVFLRKLRLGSEVYYVGQLCDAWHMSTAGGSQAAVFHLVCHGEAWVHIAGQRPVRLAPGDIAFFPHDTAHTFSAEQNVPEAAYDYSCPLPLDPSAPGTGLLCGHLMLPLHVRRLLLVAFPDFLLIRPDDSLVGSHMSQIIKVMAMETQFNQLGVAGILDRLSDVLFIYIVRYVMQHHPHYSPLLAAFSDSHIRAAVSAFVANPELNWTVEKLAGAAFQSRSSFSEHFSSVMKMPPMEFVTLWRMQLAYSMISEGPVSIMDVASKCGYESEAAFRKAFKRVIGVSPGKVRDYHINTQITDS